MNTEQERAEFEAWAKERGMTLHKASPCDGSSPYYLDTASIAAWEGYQAGRAALQSQSMPPEISRGLLGKIVDEVFDGAIEDASVIEDIYRVVARECALQSQDEDIFSPTSLTGLSKDELIRQLQWALNYWMPNIADDGTPDGERAAREAYLLLGMQAPVGREEENTPTYWERVSALQSQDREDAERFRWLTEDHTDAETRTRCREILDRMAVMSYSAACDAIDHARRAEGGEQ